MHGSPAYGPSMQVATVRAPAWASPTGTCPVRQPTLRGDPCQRRPLPEASPDHSRSRLRWVTGRQQHATNTGLVTIRVSRGRGSTLTNSSSRNLANSVALDLGLANTSRLPGTLASSRGGELDAEK